MTNEEKNYVLNLKEHIKNLKKELHLLYAEYNKAKEEGKPNSVLNSIATEINGKWQTISIMNQEIVKINAAENEKKETQLAVIPKQQTVVIEEPNKDKKAERRAFASRVGIALLVTAILGAGAYLIGNPSKKCSGKVVKVDGKSISDSISDELTNTELPIEVATETPMVTPTVIPAVAEKPFESYGEFTDASDPESLEKRAGYYYDNYFAKIYDEDVLSKVITREVFIDIISVFNGKLPVDGNFNVNELMNYTNAAKQVMIFYASTEKDEENNTRKFVPMAPVFEDGSYEQKCAQEVDNVMEPLINAMNEENDEEFKKYAVMFGELMRDQYFLVDSNTNHFSVRSRASFAARPHLWKMSYAQYVGNIFEYGIKHDIDVCIPLCYKYGTDEILMVPLSKLMATLEFVPMGQWDAVLQRAGMTTEEIKAYGNASVDDTMPVVFTRDAKNHFRELQNQKVLKNNN